jgi:hypothetical protein
MQRDREVKEALARLERYIQSGSVQIKIGPQGAIVFQGWQDRRKISDACAYRCLTLQNSWELKKAVVRAEALYGKKVNQRAIAAGVHSHDGGQTWGNH